MPARSRNNKNNYPEIIVNNQKEDLKLQELVVTNNRDFC
ncbi:MAG: hypothetical protein ACJAUO_001914 [Sediminicola sp.]|jgi:hypothetical protein